MSKITHQRIHAGQPPSVLCLATLFQTHVVSFVLFILFIRYGNNNGPVLYLMTTITGHTLRSRADKMSKITTFWEKFTLDTLLIT